MTINDLLARMAGDVDDDEEELDFNNIHTPLSATPLREVDKLLFKKSHTDAFIRQRGPEVLSAWLIPFTTKNGVKSRVLGSGNRAADVELVYPSLELVEGVIRVLEKLPIDAEYLQDSCLLDSVRIYAKCDGTDFLSVKGAAQKLLNRWADAVENYKLKQDPDYRTMKLQ